MAECEQDTAFQIRRNLSDAGCSTSFIERFLQLEGTGERAEQYRMLSQHRVYLLEALHMEQAKIDCLDYLLFTLQKEDERAGKTGKGRLP